MAEALSGYWTTPLLIIALTLLVVDALVLIAFLLWSFSKLVRNEKGREKSTDTQYVKHKDAPVIEWNTASKEGNTSEFHIPLSPKENEVESPLLGHLRNSSAAGSIRKRDLDTTMYVAETNENEGTSEKQGSSRNPTLCFSMYHYPESQQLVVSLLSGKDILRSKEEENDTQVTVSVILLKENQMQHSFTNKGPSPTFKEDFYFTLPLEKLHTAQLKFNVWIVDKYSRKVPFGDIVVLMANYVTTSGALAVIGTGDIEKEIQRKTKLTNETPKGELLLSLCYLPSADRLNIVILKGKNLPQLEEYEREIAVKVSAFVNQKVIKNKKLQMVKKSNEPVFNEAVYFDLVPGHDLAIENMSLIVSLYAAKTVVSKRLLGRVILGNIPAATAEGISHWKQMLSSPRSAIARWQELM